MRQEPHANSFLFSLASSSSFSFRRGSESVWTAPRHSSRGHTRTTGLLRVPLVEELVTAAPVDCIQLCVCVRVLCLDESNKFGTNRRCKAGIFLLRFRKKRLRRINARCAFWIVEGFNPRAEAPDPLRRWTGTSVPRSSAEEWIERFCLLHSVVCGSHLFEKMRNRILSPIVIRFRCGRMSSPAFWEVDKESSLTRQQQRISRPFFLLS